MTETTSFPPKDPASGEESQGPPRAPCVSIAGHLQFLGEANRMRMKAAIFAVLGVCLALATPVLAQQTGSIAGKVSASDGSLLPGVVVEARADVLPGPRETVTGSKGEFVLQALPPGTYTLTFTLSGMQTASRKAVVQLGVETPADATLLVQGVKEELTVTAQSNLVDKESSTITTAIPNDQISKLPVGQEYRDLIKLIPGVQYTQDAVRGPSSGSSGQDNVYKFDGVNVTLPLFGTLSAEPASHDVAEVTIIKGGAKAIDFIRAGGFAIDSVSKSGSSRYSGQLSFQFQPDTWAAEITKTKSPSRFAKDLYWTELNGGGPVVKDHLFFFASYYRPQQNR